MTGWVSAAVLVTCAGCDEPRDSCDEEGCEVTRGPPNLRAMPSLSGKILRPVPHGPMLNGTGTPAVTVDAFVWQEPDIRRSPVCGERVYVACLPAANQ